MSPEGMKKQEEQLYAWEHRADIRVGDRFLWRRGRNYGNLKYITSGSLPSRYMFIGKEGYAKFYPAGWTIALEVCRVYEGENVFGQFVDYWLTDLQAAADGKEICRDECIIINGPCARKMERFDDPFTLPEHDYIQQDGKTYMTRRGVMKHCIGLDIQKTHMLHGRQLYTPYRNYYAAKADSAFWCMLVKEGLATRDPANSKTNTAHFHLTRRGLDWLGDRLDIRINDEKA